MKHLARDRVPGAKHVPVAALHRETSVEWAQVAEQRTHGVEIRRVEVVDGEPDGLVAPVFVEPLHVVRVPVLELVALVEAHDRRGLDARQPRARARA